MTLGLNQNLSDLKTLTTAAVLIPLVIDRGEAALLFTKRTEEVRHHKGQICFPGGVRDEIDESLWHTALRETKEELGIDSTRITCLGQLPEIVTPTGFHVTPFAGFVASLKDMTPNASEIATVFSVPFKHLQNPQNVRFETREFFGSPHSMPFFSFGEHVIWGATGRMILSLFKRCRDRRFREQVFQELPSGVLTAF